MITKRPGSSIRVHWWTLAECAKRLGVTENSVYTVPGFKGVRRTPMPDYKGPGRVPNVYRRTDVEAVAKGERLPSKSVKAAKKRRRASPMLRETPNQQKIRAANEGLLSSSSPVVKMTQIFIKKVKLIDPTISSVRVEISRHSKEIVE